jgi:hypothetical protein
MRGIAGRGHRESGVFDSGGNRRLTSADETPRRYRRKIFLLPKSRFGVRATRLRADFRMPGHVDRATIIDIANNENTMLQRFFASF